MTSTKSLRKNPSQFGAAFCWHWHKNRVLTLIYTILLMVALPANFFLELVERSQTSWASGGVSGEEGVLSLGQWELQLAEDMSETFMMSFAVFALPLLTMMGLLLAVSSFGYLHNRRAVDLYGALPVRRMPMLLGGIAANLLEMLLPLALALGIVQALGWGYGDLVYPFSGQLLWQPFGLAALTAGIMYLIFLFMVVISGTLLDAALSCGLFALGWPALLLCVESLCRAALPGYDGELSEKAYLLFLPVIELFIKTLDFSTNYCYLTAVTSGALPKIDEWAMPLTMETWLLVWWIVLAVVLLALVAFCFLRRKGECAENPDAFPLPRAILRLLASLVGGLGLGILFAAIIESNLVFAFGAVLGSFLVHLITQAIWNRGLKGFTRTMPAYALTVVLLAGGAVTVCYDLTGYVNYLPAVSEVESVRVDNLYYDSWEESEVTGDEEQGNTATGADALKLYLNDMGENNGLYATVSGSDPDIYITPKFRDEESIRMLRDIQSQVLACYRKPYLPFGGSQNGAYDYGSIDLTYTLKNGKTVSRSYWGNILSKEVRSALSTLASSAEYDELRLINYYPSSCISGVWGEVYSLVYNVDDDGEDYDYGMRTDGYFDCYELTEEEKEQIWSVFLEELRSDSFTYTAGEYGAVEYGYEYESNEGLPQTAKVYHIEMNQLERANFSEELLALLDDYLGEQADKVTGIGWGDSYYVPECCTETRALIDQCIAAHSNVNPVG